MMTPTQRSSKLVDTLLSQIDSILDRLSMIRQRTPSLLSVEWASIRSTCLILRHRRLTLAISDTTKEVKEEEARNATMNAESSETGLVLD